MVDRVRVGWVRVGWVRVGWVRVGCVWGAGGLKVVYNTYEECHDQIFFDQSDWSAASADA